MTRHRTTWIKETALATLLLTAGCIPAQAASGFESLDVASVRPVMVRDASMPDEVGKGAQDFVQGMAQRALAFLGDNSMSKTGKQKAFRKLLQDSFDLDTIGKFCMGRYWRTATPEQRKEYLKLFRNMVVDVYSNRFSEYKGQKLETRSVRPAGANDAIVTSAILPIEPGNPEIVVEWRVRHRNGEFTIVDVMVEGVSMVVTQRSDFASVIQRGGGDVSVLIAHLREGKIKPQQ